MITVKNKKILLEIDKNINTIKDITNKKDAIYKYIIEFLYILFILEVSKKI